MLTLAMVRYISGGAASFNGDDLIVKAKNGVVVVVIQYRLGIFGNEHHLVFCNMC